MSMTRQAVRVQRDRYDVGGVLPDPNVDSVGTGDSILISGPAMTGKRTLALELLAATDSPVVAVSPRRAAERLRAAYTRYGSEDDLWTVDCSGATSRSSMDDTPRVKHVGSPADLTGIGIGIAKCTRDIGARADGGLGLSVLSLSTLLRYTDQRRVFNFLHVVTGRIAAANYLGVATVDPTTNDERTTSVIRSQFDGVVELRDAGDSLEGRVLGLDGASREWQPVRSDA